MIDEGPSRGRKGKAVQSKESGLPVKMIPPQHKEMVGQKWENTGLCVTHGMFASPAFRKHNDLNVHLPVCISEHVA